MKSILIFGRGFLAQSLLDYIPPSVEIALVSKFSETTKNDRVNTRYFSDIRLLPKRFDWDLVIFCSGPSDPSTLTAEAATLCTAQLRGALASSLSAKAFMYMSSGGAIYAPSQEPMNENHTLDIQSTYSLMHSQNELALQHATSIPARISLRLGNPFGRRQDPSRSVGFVTKTYRCAVAREVLDVVSNGEITRDFFHVRSLLEILFHDNLKAFRGFEIYNFGCGRSVSLNQIVDVVESVTRRSVIKNYLRNIAVRRPVVELDVGKLARHFPKLEIVPACGGVALLNQECIEFVSAASGAD